MNSLLARLRAAYNDALSHLYSRRSRRWLDSHDGPDGDVVIDWINACPEGVALDDWRRDEQPEPVQRFLRETAL